MDLSPTYLFWPASECCGTFGMFNAAYRCSFEKLLSNSLPIGLCKNLDASGYIVLRFIALKRPLDFG